jgi:hypothetical protein
VTEDLEISVKDHVVALLASGPTLLTSLEASLHGEERRVARGVIESYPELFEVFERGFPDSGPKSVWVKLRPAGTHG